MAQRLKKLVPLFLEYVPIKELVQIICEYSCATIEWISPSIKDKKYRVTLHSKTPLRTCLPLNGSLTFPWSNCSFLRVWVSLNKTAQTRDWIMRRSCPGVEVSVDKKWSKTRNMIGQVSLRPQELSLSNTNVGQDLDPRCIRLHLLSDSVAIDVGNTRELVILDELIPVNNLYVTIQYRTKYASANRDHLSSRVIIEEHA